MIPGLGRYSGEGNGYPLQYSGLENFMDCIVHGVTKSWTRLNDFHFTSITGTLSTSIIVVLNSQSDNSNMPVMSGSGGWSVFSEKQSSLAYLKMVPFPLSFPEAQKIFP